MGVSVDDLFYVLLQKTNSGRDHVRTPDITRSSLRLASPEPNPCSPGQVTASGPLMVGKFTVPHA